MKFYDVAIIGAGPAGYMTAYRLIKNKPELKIAIFEKGNPLEKRICPIQTGKVKECIHCSTCAVMEGGLGAGAKSDGKYNITNDFGGSLFEKIGYEKSLKLQKEADEINLSFLNGIEPKLFSSTNNEFKSLCLKNNLHLLDADIRHLGTDNNLILGKNLFDYLSDKVDIYYNSPVKTISKNSDNSWNVNGEEYKANKLVIAAGRAGSKWVETICDNLKIKRNSNRVDIGIRFELPYITFKHLTDKLYESKIVYRTELYEDFVRTFCMNPQGFVVNENTNGIITVNGHSNSENGEKSQNTNFALLVSQNFTEPFNDSNEYGESIARLSNMLGKGVIVQRFGDLIRCKRSTAERLKRNTVIPTLKAEPGDLALVLPHRILEDIKEMIYALDTIAPGTKNDDNLLYGVEVKFYNNIVNVNERLLADDNLYIIGDCSGITHSLSQAAASGLFVADDIIEGM